MLQQQEIDQIVTALKEALQQKKDWLSKQDVMNEFGIKPTLLNSLINDNKDPLPYTTFGNKKQLFHREDINKWLRERMRNVG